MECGGNGIRRKRKMIKIHQFHYENTPMQYTAIFHSCKNNNFHMKNCDIFLIFAQNIDRGYTLERLTEAFLTSAYDLCFKAKMRK